MTMFRFALRCLFAAVAAASAGTVESAVHDVEVGMETSRIARVGIMTDTHVQKTMESCSRVKSALELFRRQGVEMVVNCGDIADCYLPEGYCNYRATVNAVYPEASERPKEVFVYAGHDVCGFRKGGGWSNLDRDAPAAFAEMKRHLGIPNDPACDFVWKGLPFAVFPQFTGSDGFLSWADYEAVVARLCRENPGKPVFVLEHVPAAGTTFHSRHWGCDQSRRILNRYPQVVQISGHVHGSLKSERQIWQGAFTAVNAGCLQTWGGFAPGSTPPHQAKPNFGVLVMDVYADRLVFFRHDVRDGRACAAPWIVPLPFAAKTAPYRPETHVRTQPLPAFASDAAVAVTPEGDGYRIAFPEARAGADPFMYRLSAQRRTAEGGWEAFTRDDIFGDFWKADADRSGTMAYRLDKAFFTAGETYRMTVTPLDFFYREGRAASCTFTATHAALPQVWTLSDPADVSFKEPDTAGLCEPTVGGRIAPAKGMGSLHLRIPDEALRRIRPGTLHRLVLDIDLDQPDGAWCAWQLALVALNGPALGRVQTSPGSVGTLRYVFAFTAPEKGLDGLFVNFGYKSPGASFRIVGAELY